MPDPIRHVKAPIHIDAQSNHRRIGFDHRSHSIPQAPVAGQIDQVSGECQRSLRYATESRIRAIRAE